MPICDQDAAEWVDVIPRKWVVCTCQRASNAGVSTLMEGRAHVHCHVTDVLRAVRATAVQMTAIIAPAYASVRVIQAQGHDPLQVRE
eukprot:1237784-Rhodomonas_salina.1